MEKENLLNKVKASEQVISMIMGILVVLVIGGLVYRYFQQNKPAEKTGVISEQGESVVAEEENQTQETKTVSGVSSRIHKVEKGENLWEIAEKYYQSGYNWVDIAEENNLAEPGLLAIGQELKIPEVESKKATVSELPQTGISGDVITGDSYTVQKGDSLSKIAGRAYGDIFAWPKIWAANRDQIGNPNVVYPGTKIVIPRG